MLKDTDDLDGDLFKNITKTNFSKTMPAQNNKKPASVSNRNKNFSFEDDPLADFDSLVGKPNQFKPSTTNNKLANKPPAFSSNIGYNPNFNQTMPMPSKSKSLAEDLFGKADDIGFRAINSEEPDFKLNNDKNNMNVSHQSAKADEEINFGGYQPSALSSSGSRNHGGIKRNVSFGDDLFGADATESIFASLIRKPPPSKQSESEAQNNLMRTMPNPTNKSTEDWLGGSNSTQNNNNTGSRRKSIDFSIDDLLKPRDTNKANVSVNSNKNNLNTGSDLDWLGFKDSSKDSLDQPGYRPTFDKPPLNILNPSSNQNQQPQKPVNQLISLLGVAKDSMNSSFAESIENNDTKPSKSIDNLQNINPMQFNEPTKTESRVMSPNESNDGWLNNLMSKKGGLGLKKV